MERPLPSPWTSPRPSRAAAVAAVLALLLAGAARADDNTISLGVGSQRVISAGGVSKIAVADPSVADVRNVGGQILVIGAGEGRTSVIIWKSNGQRVTYTVSVRKQDPNEVAGEMRRLLGEIEGVNIRMVGDRRSEEHTSELQSLRHLVCRLL